MILILDDHPVSRQGIEAIIRMRWPEAQVVQTGTVKEAVRYVKESQIDMAFVDVNLGKENGFDFLEWVRDTGCTIKVIFITSSSRESDFQYAKKLGVDAYILKEAFIDEIVYGLKVVERGGKFYSASLIEQLNQVSEDEARLSGLTEREMDVLILLSQGYSNIKISQKLVVTEGTIKKHITSILSKLNLESRVEAVIFANKNSFIVRSAVKRLIQKDRRRR